ncbi:MAG: hypothetical protein KDM81_04820 [Verrucomicrobiae bacterium]|nr:hypothetical protein [Verrucomicrobiae bacterium]MCP5521278.1 hypothetical protein [Verrucomicrobiales bacterium]MCP5522439.1 hypothetical protein [Verrucomicrobiales bacterium]MCP5524172.1 hypothetical protein [Verrucomicrobiales bacterium]MCP5525138.1 hypothetical protein [Verrucomicrobiales bacterium]
MDCGGGHGVTGAIRDCRLGRRAVSEGAIQIRADSFVGERPPCPRECPGRLHRHGFYRRYAAPAGSEFLTIARYLCRRCGLTVSVLPVEHLPYRPVKVPRLEAFLDGQAGVGTGPDPPPGLLEAGCLRRAWARFQTRGSHLQKAFDLRLPSVIDSARDLWLQMRRAKRSLAGILDFLARVGKQSLLGDYRCLRLPA